jgi:sulfur-oxidizing protein SoxX
MHMTLRTSITGLAAGSLLLAGCASLPSSSELDRIAAQSIQGSFRDQGIAKVDRIKQDLAQAACSSDKAPDEATVERIQAEARATIKWPANGWYLGDFREGERIAQSGRGMTWTDASTATSANGGNCYNCHQIDKKELSYGTIGPSLWNYGKNRGITDVTAETVAPIIHYTWAKLWNSKAYAACSNMPRFGHKNLLNEEQIRHIMSLLLDPRSPVNQ